MARGRSANLAIPLFLDSIACVTVILSPARETALASRSPSPARRRGRAAKRL